MTDEELLAKWRARRGDITQATAKELEKLDRRFAHLRKAKEQKGRHGVTTP
ncbi:MAG: hypothetical protein QOF07_2740 [Bradyrhizobium sp.]|jgi:hypothetical protein|nr:hypothetical protein [Bradyrhizobium sp.]